MKKVKIKLKKRYKILLITIFLITTVMVYAHFIEPNTLKVNEYKITDKSIPSSFEDIKVVHISDIHYGRTINEKQLTKIVKQINVIKPDIVLFTGDLFDRDIKLTTNITNEVTTAFKNINATLGKYAVSGNHDKLFSSYQEVLDNSEFTLLDNNYELIYNKGYEPIFIGGINTNTEFNMDDIMAPINENKKNKNESINYKIIMMHMPDYIDQVLESNNINLVLAGHSHNGQMRLPYIGALTTPKGAKKYFNPYYNIKDTDFYISSGLGCSVANYRLFDKPSFNYYILNKNK